jgi:cytochrome c oxidase assembly factor CtaG
MSQKLGFPYMGLKANSLIFFVGIILSVLTYLFGGLYALGYNVPLILIEFLVFLGIFLTGWALLGFAVMKEMLEKQKLIAFLFAVILLAAVFSVTVGFGWSVFHLVPIGKSP